MLDGARINPPAFDDSLGSISGQTTERKEAT